MLTRRSTTALLAGAAAAPALAWGADATAHVVFYNAVGPTLAWWQVDITNAALTRQGSVEVPARIQYVWRHPKAHVLYVASSNFVPLGNADGKHHLTAFRIDPVNGALVPFGDPVALRARPIHITVDAEGDWLLAAYNIPSMMSVHASRRMPRSGRRRSRRRRSTEGSTRTRSACCRRIEGRP